MSCYAPWLLWLYPCSLQPNLVFRLMLLKEFQNLYKSFYYRSICRIHPAISAFVEKMQKEFLSVRKATLIDISAMKMLTFFPKSVWDNERIFKHNYLKPKFNVLKHNLFICLFLNNFSSCFFPSFLSKYFSKHHSSSNLS